MRELDKSTPDIKAQPTRRLSDIVSSEYLHMISGASGFSFAEDPGSEHVGYTDLRTRRIYVNPVFLDRLSISALGGFLLHEAGHHTNETQKFQNFMTRHIERMEIPEAYAGSPTSKERFKTALWSHLGNGLADIFLETYMGRRPYGIIEDNFRALYSELGERPTLKHLPKPEQLIQYMLGEGRYGSSKPTEVLIDDDVHEAYQRLQQNGALKALGDMRPYTSPFASPKDRERGMGRRFEAYEKAFLPEYLKLMEKEIEERKKQKQKSQAKQGQSTQSSSIPSNSVPPTSEEEQEIEAKQGQSTQSGSVPSGNVPSSSEPLTSEEEQEIIEKLLDELQQAGQRCEVHTPSEEEKKRQKDFTNEIKKQASAKQQQDMEPQQKELSEDPESELRDASERLRRARELSKIRGLADANQVQEGTVRKWNDIKNKYRREIASMASSLAEVFLEDRRKRLEFLKREGDIVPGLEYETVAAILGGDADPQTRMAEVRNPEFLETEIEVIVDTSGSMSGSKIDSVIETLVVKTEAFKQVRDDLAGEDLLMEDEQPLRVGVTKFSVTAKRVTKLEEPLDDNKEMRIINAVSMIGGGTDETEAIEVVSQMLSKGNPNVIKIIIVYTDGYGNKEAVQPILQQIEQDDEIIMLVVGIGTQEEVGGVTDTYVRSESSNIFAAIAETPTDILPITTSFIKQQVEKRRQFL